MTRNLAHGKPTFLTILTQVVPPPSCLSLLLSGGNTNRRSIFLSNPSGISSLQPLLSFCSVKEHEDLSSSPVQSSPGQKRYNETVPRFKNHLPAKIANTPPSAVNIHPVIHNLKRNFVSFIWSPGRTSTVQCRSRFRTLLLR